MKIGDLVKLKHMPHRTPIRVGLVVDLIEKKCWRTHTQGKRVNWNTVEPEPHAVVVINGDQRTVPITDLVLFNEEG
jgi:hypothetical protein